MPQALPPLALGGPPSERQVVGANVRRLMARYAMTLDDAVAATGLDERTLRSVLRGQGRPHARTLHRLARGLGVAVDELLRDDRDAAASFDRATNPAVAEAAAGRPDLFAGWTAGEFRELASRFAAGGQLTVEGAVAAAERMNRRRELLQQAALVLETDQAELLEEFVALLYRRAVVAPGDEQRR